LAVYYSGPNKLLHSVVEVNEKKIENNMTLVLCNCPLTSRDFLNIKQTNYIQHKIPDILTM